MYNGEIMHVVTNFIRKKRLKNLKLKKSKAGRKDGNETNYMQSTTNKPQNTLLLIKKLYILLGIRNYYNIA